MARFNILDLFGPSAQNLLTAPAANANGVQNMLMTRPNPKPAPVMPAVDPQTTAAVAGPAPAPVPAASPQVAQAAPATSPKGLFSIDPDRKAVLNDFFLGLAAGQTPQQSLALGAAQAAKGKSERKNTNDTVDWLKGRGMDEASARQLASNSSALGEYIQGINQQKKPVEVNGKFVDPDTFQVLADFSDPKAGPEPTALMKELEAAGLKPGTPEYQQAILANNRPKGMMVESDGQGGFRMIQGADVSGGANLNVEQGKNAGFLLRAQDANKNIDNLEKEGQSFWNGTVGRLPVVGNYALGAGAQKYEQAKRDFVNAVLRQESGAVISDQEFANAERQYFPQPGDTQEVIAQKRQNRENAIAGFRIRSGPGAAAVDQMQPSDGGAPATSGTANGIKWSLQQ